MPTQLLGLPRTLTSALSLALYPSVRNRSKYFLSAIVLCIRKSNTTKIVDAPRPHCHSDNARVFLLFSRGQAEVCTTSLMDKCGSLEQDSTSAQLLSPYTSRRSFSQSLSALQITQRNQTGGFFFDFFFIYI